MDREQPDARQAWDGPDLSPPRGHWVVDDPVAPEDEATRRLVQFLFATAVEAFEYGNKHQDMSVYEEVANLLETVLPTVAEFVGTKDRYAPDTSPDWHSAIQYEAWGRDGEGEDPRPWWAKFAYRPDETEGGMQEVYGSAADPEPGSLRDVLTEEEIAEADRLGKNIGQ